MKIAMQKYFIIQPLQLPDASTAFQVHGQLWCAEIFSDEDD